jgi:HEAT repeat protein
MYVHPLIEKLLRGSVEERRDAADTLLDLTRFDWVRDRGERDISFASDALAGALFDTDELVRRKALGALLAAQGDRQDVAGALPAVMRILASGELDDLKCGASHLLKDAVDQGADIGVHIPSLVALLAPRGADDVTLGVADALALHHIRRKEWEPLCDLLAHANKEVSQEAAGTLHRMGSPDLPDSVLRSLDALLRHQDHEVNLVAAKVLIAARAGSERIGAIRDLLLGLVSCTEKKIAAHALAVLCDLIVRGVSCWSPWPRSAIGAIAPGVAHLERLISSGDGESRKLALRILTVHHSHVGRLAEVKRWLSSPDVEVRMACFEGIGHCGLLDCKLDLSPFIPEVIELLPLPGEQRQHLLSLISRRRFDLDELERRIASVVRDADERWDILDQTWKSKRSNEITALEKQLEALPSKGKLAFLLGLARKEDGELRRWAACRIASLGGAGRVSILKGIPDLVTWLSSEDMFLRAAAAEAVAQCGKKTGYAKALPAVIPLLGDEVSAVRENAVRAIGRAAEVGIDVSATFLKLEALLVGDVRKEVRLGAAIALFNAAAGMDKLRAHVAGIVQGLADPYDAVRGMCRLTLTRHLIPRGDRAARSEVQRALDGLAPRNKEVEEVAQMLASVEGAAM